MPQRRICQACNVVVTFEHDWKSAHGNCPKKNQETGKTCPEMGCDKPLIWRVGTYATFQGCPDFPKCPGKISAPRGKGAGKYKVPKDEPKPAPTKVPPGEPGTLRVPIHPPKFNIGDRVRMYGPEVEVYRLNPSPIHLDWNDSDKAWIVNSSDPSGHGMYSSAFTEVSVGPTCPDLYAKWADMMNSGLDLPPWPEYRQNYLAGVETPKMPDTAATPAKTDKTDLGNALANVLLPSIQDFVIKTAGDAARQVVTEAGAGTVKFVWVDPEKNEIKIEAENGHAVLPEMVALIQAGFNNLLVVGPAGSGKTTLAHDLAKALKRPFAAVSCTAGMSESYVTGKAIPNLTTGVNVYEPAPFVTLYEGGGVFLFDEVDAADPNMLLVVNSAIANGHLNIPARASQPEATRHKDTVIVCAANTFGLGADRMYVGRNQLDAAFLDRFCGAVVEVDYDKKLEQGILSDAQTLAKIWSIREKIGALKLRRLCGTRAVIAVARHMRSGKSQKQALSAVFSTKTGWTAEELTKVGM